MDSTTADKIDKLYKNYEILSEAKDKISEVSISPIHSFIQILNSAYVLSNAYIIRCDFVLFTWILFSSFFIFVWKHLA